MPGTITGEGLAKALTGAQVIVDVANAPSCSPGRRVPVLEYDATTEAAINVNFITGLTDPSGLLVTSVPEPYPWSMIAMGGVALLGMMLRKRQPTA